MNWRAYFFVTLGGVTSGLAVSAVSEGVDWAVTPLLTGAWFCLWGLLTAIRRQNTLLRNEIANLRRDVAALRSRS